MKKEKKTGKNIPKLIEKTDKLFCEIMKKIAIDTVYKDRNKKLEELRDSIRELKIDAMQVEGWEIEFADEKGIVYDLYKIDNNLQDYRLHTSIYEGVRCFKEAYKVWVLVEERLKERETLKGGIIMCVRRVEDINGTIAG